MVAKASEMGIRLGRVWILAQDEGMCNFRVGILGLEQSGWLSL